MSMIHLASVGIVLTLAGSTLAAEPLVLLPQKPVELIGPNGKPFPKVAELDPFQREQGAELIVHARRALDSGLVDYPAARFRNVQLIVPDDPDVAVALCGEMNAKNRIGGYNGWQPFVVWDGPLGVIIDYGDKAQSRLLGLCLEGGIIDTRDYSSDLTAK